MATGANQQRYVPAFAAGLHPHIVQIHSRDYRRPSQLPQGSVLIVGAGNSGAQIALELAEAGRKVVLSGPDTGSLPRRFLGRIARAIVEGLAAPDRAFQKARLRGICTR